MNTILVLTAQRSKAASCPDQVRQTMTMANDDGACDTI